MNYDYEFLCFELLMCDIFNMEMDAKFLYTFAMNPLMMTNVCRNICRGL
jgi:hypothetical protein